LLLAEGNADLKTIISEAAMEAHAGRAGRRVGLVAMNPRWRKHTIDNPGGFRTADGCRNAIFAGERCHLSAEDGIDYWPGNADF